MLNHTPFPSRYRLRARVKWWERYLRRHETMFEEMAPAPAWQSFADAYSAYLRSLHKA